MADTDGQCQWHRTVPLNGADDSSSSRPFLDVVVCFTSVPDEKRTQWVQYVKEMGGLSSLDLTSEVTHLVVGDCYTPKYQYVAKERPDVLPMTTKWIEAARELWINDQEIDMEALEKEHRLPILSTLRLSMTGCDDPTERSEIAERIKTNGGSYEGDLTKQITHLISFRTEGAKYKAAKLWGLRIVSIEWFNDSLERGMILNETYYDPVIPAEQRGVGAWDKSKPKRVSLGKRSREESVVGLEGGKRKLRRTASSKLSSGNGILWADISGSSAVPQVMRSGVWDAADEQAETLVVNVPAQDFAAKPEVTNHRPVIQGAFSNCRFFLDGFIPKKTKIMYEHLTSQGGEVSHTIEGLVEPPTKQDPANPRAFRIIPHNTLESDYAPSPESVQTVTEWWVERCLYNKKFIEPSEHIFGRPFPKFPIEGFKNIAISSAAFTGTDLLHVQKVAKLIGATYSEDLTPKSSVLVTKSETALRKDKLAHAQQWNVPVVKADWLWECIKTGERISIMKYTLRKVKNLGSENPLKEHRIERSRSEVTKPVSRLETRTLSNPLNAPRNSRRDKTAFISDEPLPVKEEPMSQRPTPTIADSTASTSVSAKTEPLTEISQNASPSRTVSTAPAPSDHPAPRPLPEDLSRNISNLLAKTKNAVQPETETRKRVGTRVLGRATSSGSVSTPFSRPSTADSSATRVDPSSKSTLLEVGGVEEVGGMGGMFMDSDPREVESQPPATQLQYDDDQSREYREKVMAKINGEEVRKRVPERTISLGDVAGLQGRETKVRTRRARAPPGFK